MTAGSKNAVEGISWSSDSDEEQAVLVVRSTERGNKTRSVMLCVVVTSCMFCFEKRSHQISRSRSCVDGCWPENTRAAVRCKRCEAFEKASTSSYSKTKLVLVVCILAQACSEEKKMSGRLVVWLNFIRCTRVGGQV